MKTSCHTSHSYHGADHASQAKQRQKHTKELNVSSKTVNFPLFLVTTLFFKRCCRFRWTGSVEHVCQNRLGTAHPQLLKRKAQQTRSQCFGNGGVNMLTLRHHLALRSRTITHRVGRSWPTGGHPPGGWARATSQKKIRSEKKVLCTGEAYDESPSAAGQKKTTE